MTTMIALVGEQTVPNVLPIRHYHSDSVIFIYSERTEQVYERMKVVLQKEANIDGFKVEPYNIENAAQAIEEEIIKRVENQSLIFNLTGGTKTMVIAAYQVAEKRKAPIIYVESEGGRSNIDLYEWKTSNLVHQLNEPILKYLSLHEILDLSLGRGKDIKGKFHWYQKEPNPQDGSGHIFEIAILQAVRDYEKYEVMGGVKGRNNQVDIDVMVGYRSQMGLIEAKLGSRGLEGVKQLSTAKLYLKGTYNKQFLVLNNKPSKDQEMMCEALDITIISLLHYQENMNALTQEDSNTLLTEINKVMKVG